jgi:tetratricopeptide (TPR) repeat protein
MYVGTFVSHHFMVPYTKNERFIGRDNLLAQLFKKLCEPQPHEYNHRIALYGLGGVGKTQTVYANRACYDSIFWISGTSQASLLSDFQRIATLTKCTADGTNTDPLQYVKEVLAWLEKQTSWLLVIDNLDDIKVTPGFLPMNDTKKHTIITTRNPDSEGIPAQGLEVGLLDPADAVFLLSTLSKITIKDTLERKQAYQIVHELGYLPLAIEQAAAYVREAAGTFATFLEDYNKIRKDIHKWTPRGNRPYYSHSVATTWSMSFEIIRNNHPQSAALFQLLSFLNPDGILIDFLEAGAEVLHEDMQRVVSNQIERANALLELEKFSLLKWDRQNKTLLIHRVVQRVVQDEISDTDLETLSVTIIELCDRTFPQEWENENRALCRVYLGQVMTPLFRLEGIRTRNSAMLRVRWSNIMYRVGWFLRADGKLSDSERFSSKAVEVNTEVLGEDHPDTLTSMHNLATAYLDQGRTDDGARLLEQVLEKRRRILGDDHPGTLTTKNNLATAYLGQVGRMDDAARMFEQVLEKQRQILGDDHPDTLTTRDNLAVAYWEQGRK